METKDNTSGVFVLRQDLDPMEKRHMDQDYSKCRKERSGGIARRTTAVGCDILWELDSEVSVEPDGDCVGTRSVS